MLDLRDFTVCIPHGLLNFYSGDGPNQWNPQGTWESGFEGDDYPIHICKF